MSGQSGIMTTPNPAAVFIYLLLVLFAVPLALLAAGERVSMAAMALLSELKS
jgi:hypothetical protein